MSCARSAIAQIAKRRSAGQIRRALSAGANPVLLEPDVAKAFPTEKEVNEALRLVIQLAKLQSRKKSSSAKV